MNPLCDRCTQRLLDYIAAGNHLVDIKAQIQRLPCDKRTAGSELLALAHAAATAARKHLADCQLGLHCHCGNKLRTEHITTSTARKRKILSAR